MLLIFFCSLLLCPPYVPPSPIEDNQQQRIRRQKGKKREERNPYGVTPGAYPYTIDFISSGAPSAHPLVAGILFLLPNSGRCLSVVMDSFLWCDTQTPVAHRPRCDYRSTLRSWRIPFVFCWESLKRVSFVTLPSFQSLSSLLSCLCAMGVVLGWSRSLFEKWHSASGILRERGGDELGGWAACARAPHSPPEQLQQLPHHFIVFFTLLLMAFPYCCATRMLPTTTTTITAFSPVTQHTNRRDDAKYSTYTQKPPLKTPRSGEQEKTTHVILTRPTSPAVSCYFHFSPASVRARTWGYFKKKKKKKPGRAVGGRLTGWKRKENYPLSASKRNEINPAVDEWRPTFPRTADHWTYTRISIRGRCFLL